MFGNHGWCITRLNNALIGSSRPAEQHKVRHSVLQVRELYPPPKVDPAHGIGTG